MDPDDDDDIIEAPPPKLVYSGLKLTKRFLKKPILYKQQKEALTNLVNWFSNDTTKGYTAVVKMPTGSGKTGIICCLPYFLGGAIREGKITDIDLAKPILVIAPGLEILKQLDLDLLHKPFLSRLGLIKPEEIDLAYRVHPIIKTEDVKGLSETAKQQEIVLTNAQKWRRTRKTDPTPNYEDLPNDLFSVIIVDEAHHLPAKQWQEIIDKFKDHAKVVFFTATPYRTDKKEITTDLSLSTVGFAYTLSREEAIKDRLIRPLQETIIPLSNDACMARPAKKSKYFTEDKKEVYIMQVVKKVKDRLKEKNEYFPLPGSKKHASIIIAYNIDEAKEVKTLCTEAGFQSVALIHFEKRKQNAVIVSNIKEGKYEVVIIVKMLLEGFDYPPFSIAGIVTKIVSETKFAQFIGRIQRIVRNGGEIEDEKIVGDVISHEFFDQEKLFKKYHELVIPEEEDKSLDDE